MALHLERITDTLHPMYNEAIKLYRISFPYHEQREKVSQEKILRDREYHFCLIYDEALFVGLVLYWESMHFIYIEHFCILPEMRNKQYGKKTLNLFMEQQKKILLEIDPPVDAIARRRKGFYERCGFTQNFFSHIHPPYHRENEGHKLAVMSCPGEISQEIFETFCAYLREKVMLEVFA